MKSQVLSNWDMPDLSSFALLLFFAVFMTMLIFVFNRKTKSLQTKISYAPLDEGSLKDE